jgi:peptidoglycan/xylan/chitin deacetylase (PgdA/CDA1 family)
MVDRRARVCSSGGRVPRSERGSCRARLRGVAVALVAGVALAFVAPAVAAAAPLVVSLDFDDGATEAYVAGGLLDSHAMRGSFYINSGLVGDPGYMSWTQLAELQAQGHEIAGHTRSHPRLAEVFSTVGAAEVRRQVCGDRLELRRHGFDVTEFAYPYGSAGAGVEAIVRDCGYRTGRASRGIPAEGEPVAEQIPPPDLYWTRIPPPPMATMPLETLQGYVTRAEPAGGWIHILFHRICEGCRPYSTPEPVFRAFLDWLAGRAASGTVVVKTVQQVMDEYWGFDKVPPDTSIASAPTQLAADAPASFEFSASEEASSFDCQLDAGAWEPCNSPTSYTNLTQAVHSFAVRATDRGRNTDPSPARRDFTVGTPPPPVSRPAPAAPPTSRRAAAPPRSASRSATS